MGRKKEYSYNMLISHFFATKENRMKKTPGVCLSFCGHKDKQGHKVQTKILPTSYLLKRIDVWCKVWTLCWVVIRVLHLTFMFTLVWRQVTIKSRDLTLFFGKIEIKFSILLFFNYVCIIEGLEIAWIKHIVPEIFALEFTMSRRSS